MSRTIGFPSPLRLATFIVGLLCITGCAIQLGVPTTPATAMTDAGASYADASKFVDDARLLIGSRLHDVDTFDSITKKGIGAGLAGAAAAAVFKTHSDVILGMLTLSGVSYSANTATDPPTVSAILNAGLANLDCIDAAGEQGAAAFEGQRIALSRRRAAIADAVVRLGSDLATANSDPKSRTSEPDNYANEVASARKSLALGQLTLGSIDRFIGHSPVAPAMIRAARSTVYEVNQQLREKSPSIDTIAKSGSIVGTFANSAADIKSNLAAGIAHIGDAKVAAHSGPPMNQTLIDDENALKASLEGVEQLLVPISIASVTLCKTQFAVAAPLTLINATPVELNAGASVSLRTISGASVVPRWSGELPTDLTWNLEISALSMTARADAKTNSYRLRLADYTGHLSEEFAINVHGAPAKPSVPAAGTDQVPTPIVKKTVKKAGPPPPPVATPH